MKVEILITLKTEVLDPQGDAVRRALHAQGFTEVQSLRVGKRIALDLETQNVEEARTRAEAMCKALLANPVMETFEIRVLS